MFILSSLAANFSMANKYPTFYIIVKSILILLLIACFFWVYLKISLFVLFFGIIKFNLISKLHTLKIFVERKFNHNSKDLRNPKKFPFIDIFADWKKKKQLAKIKKQTFNKQRYNFTNNIYRRKGNNSIGGISRDNWSGRVVLKQELITKADALQDIQEKYELLYKQKKRFWNYYF